MMADYTGSKSRANYALSANPFPIQGKRGDGRILLQNRDISEPRLLGLPERRGSQSETGPPEALPSHRRERDLLKRAQEFQSEYP
jgi:hypothetical protein